MIKKNSLKMVVLSLLLVCMSVFSLVGCQGKNNVTQSSSSTSTSNSTKSNTKTNSTEMKEKTQTAIKSLVTAGTITQAQADKIVTALTPDKAKGNSQGNKENSKPDNKGQDNSKDRGKPNDGNKKSPLIKLVSDGTITQAQADAVMEKIKANMPNKDQNSSKDTSKNSTNQ